MNFSPGGLREIGKYMNTKKKGYFEGNWLNMPLIQQRVNRDIQLKHKKI